MFQFWRGLGSTSTQSVPQWGHRFHPQRAVAGMPRVVLHPHHRKFPPDPPLPDTPKTRANIYNIYVDVCFSVFFKGIHLQDLWFHCWTIMNNVRGPTFHAWHVDCWNQSFGSAVLVWPCSLGSHSLGGCTVPSTGGVELATGTLSTPAFSKAFSKSRVIRLSRLARSEPPQFSWVGTSASADNSVTGSAMTWVSGKLPSEGTNGGSKASPRFGRLMGFHPCRVGQEEDIYTYMWVTKTIQSQTQKMRIYWTVLRT